MGLFSWIYNLFFSGKSKSESSVKSSNEETKDEIQFDEEKIDELTQQFEYYFSPSNLIANKKLASMIQRNEGGFVNISVFMEYGKIKALNATREEVIESIKRSDELELNETKDKVKTKKNIYLDKDSILKRTVKLSGFPEDTLYKDIKQLIVERFGEIQRLSMMHKVKDFEKSFSGTVIVEFSNESQVLEAEEGFEAFGDKIVCEKMSKIKESVSKQKKRRNAHRK